MKRQTIMILALVFFLAGQPAHSTGDTREITGTWQGRLEFGGQSLTVVVNISRDQAGELNATMDSPDQGAIGIAIDELSLQEEELRFSVKAVAGEYSGRFVDEDRIRGEWKQGGTTLPLELKKTSVEITKPERPQMPERPFPYREYEVTFENETAGITIAGTLTVPEGEGPHPAVILITGSGSQDRDESIAGHKPFLVLSDHLTRRGIAVLRNDDRGVGGTGGDLGKSTSEDLAGDVAAGLEFLRTRPEINPRQIGLIGHSEGGIIAPMVASRDRDVAFIILMAGTGMTGEEIIIRQSRLISLAQGVPEEKVEGNIRLQRETFRIVRENPDDQAALEKLRALYRDSLSGDAATESQEPDSQQMKQILTPWFRFFLSYDPKQALKKVHCPVLAVGGGKDLQVPAEENLRIIAGSLREGGNRDVTVKIFPGLNHLFQTAKTGSPMEYAKIEETIAPQVLGYLTGWLGSLLKDLEGDATGKGRR